MGPGRVDAFVRRLHARLAADWLPTACLVCRQVGRRASPAGSLLCEACAAALPGRDVCRCARCALRYLPADAGPARPVCHHCRRRPPAFDAAFALADYGGPVSALILAMKAGRLEIGRALGRLLAAQSGALPQFDLLVPVPLAPAALAQRGFNQALELARPLARARGCPLHAGLLRRERETVAQKTLDARARQANLRGVFAPPDAAAAARIAGRSVAVVDDVMTTGATLQEVTAVLRAAGAHNVSCIVVARTA